MIRRQPASLRSFAGRRCAIHGGFTRSAVFPNPFAGFYPTVTLPDAGVLPHHDLLRARTARTDGARSTCLFIEPDSDGKVPVGWAVFAPIHASVGVPRSLEESPSRRLSRRTERQEPWQHEGPRPYEELRPDEQLRQPKEMTAASGLTAATFRPRSGRWASAGERSRDATGHKLRRSSHPYGGALGR